MNFILLLSFRSVSQKNSRDEFAHPVDPFNRKDIHVKSCRSYHWWYFSRYSHRVQNREKNFQIQYAHTLDVCRATFSSRLHFDWWINRKLIIFSFKYFSMFSKISLQVFPSVYFHPLQIDRFFHIIFCFIEFWKLNISVSFGKFHPFVKNTSLFIFSLKGFL